MVAFAENDVKINASAVVSNPNRFHPVPRLPPATIGPPKPRLHKPQPSKSGPPGRSLGEGRQIRSNPVGFAPDFTYSDPYTDLPCQGAAMAGTEQRPLKSRLPGRRRGEGQSNPVKSGRFRP